MIGPRAPTVVMATVLVALLPGAIIQATLFGIGTWMNAAAAAGSAVGIEALVARLRGISPTALLRDGSAVLTALLLALSLPPDVPVGVVVIGTLIALGLGKHAFGGIGANRFNPAMVGYAVLLLSYPALLAAWPNPGAVGNVDGITGATPLDVFKHRGALTVADLWTHARGFGAFGGAGWEWLNAGYLLGGVVLIARRVIDWRIPVTMLATLGVLATVGYDAGSSASLGSPLYHYFSGATMLGAFFVATDPATCPTTRRGRVVFAVLIGATLFLIRSASNYPDGVAFAVLLANAASPLIDQTVGRRREEPL
jgi:electron transport complex protein RnfD